MQTSIWLRKNWPSYSRQLTQRLRTGCLPTTPVARSTHGDWEGWIAYFLEGVAVISGEATDLIRSLFEITSQDRAGYLERSGATVVGARLFELLPRNPLITTKWVVKACDTTRPTAGKAIDSLVSAGILEETSGRKRDKVYAYRRYLDLLKEGTEL